jgi:hypothetical protein
MDSRPDLAEAPIRDVQPRPWRTLLPGNLTDGPGLDDISGFSSSRSNLVALIGLLRAMLAPDVLVNNKQDTPKGGMKEAPRYRRKCVQCERRKRQKTAAQK